jgi:hypothetical protein
LGGGYTMIITIYDYRNRVKAITLPDKEISEIFVTVLSGDETGYIRFVDGTKLRFDAATDRFEDYYDGSYSVEGENIDKWLNFKSSTPRTVSYARRDVFWEDER